MVFQFFPGISADLLVFSAWPWSFQRSLRAESKSTSGFKGSRAELGGFEVLFWASKQHGTFVSPGKEKTQRVVTSPRQKPYST